jgi:hypothetical protein
MEEGNFFPELIPSAWDLSFIQAIKDLTIAIPCPWAGDRAVPL